MTERIHNWISKDEDEDSIPGLPPAPTAAYQNAFEAEIQRQRESLPTSLRNNCKTSTLAYSSSRLCIIDGHALSQFYYESP